MAERILEIQAIGRNWKLITGDMEALWDDMVIRNEAEQTPWDEDERLPYWAELWPSSLALAEWLSKRERDIRGRRCLDMGCGMGFTAMAGAWLGAKVTGMDYDATALTYAARNAEQNGLTGIDWKTMDWRKPEMPKHSLDIIWGADIMYELAFARPIAAFLAHCLSKDGRAWLAEPGRSVFEHLLRECAINGLMTRKIEKNRVWPIIEQKVPVPVNIWEIRHDRLRGSV